MNWEHELAVGQDAMHNVRRFYPQGQQLLSDLRCSTLQANARSKEAAYGLANLPGRSGATDLFLNLVIRMITE
jgi:hypothetical protein